MYNNALGLHCVLVGNNSQYGDFLGFSLEVVLMFSFLTLRKAGWCTYSMGQPRLHSCQLCNSFNRQKWDDLAFLGVGQLNISTYRNNNKFYFVSLVGKFLDGKFCVLISRLRESIDPWNWKGLHIFFHEVIKFGNLCQLGIEHVVMIHPTILPFSRGLKEPWKIWAPRCS